MRFLVWLFCLSLLLLPAPLSQAKAPLPFGPGERLVYSLKWKAVPFGDAEFAVQRSSLGGKPTLHLTLTARSGAFMDMFYKVRNRMESHVTPEFSRSLRYEKNTREGSRRRHFVVDFAGNRARYKNLLKDAPRELRVSAAVLDPLAVLYGFRAFGPGTVGEEFVRPTSDGKKAATARAKVLRRERITVLAGTFDALVVQPDMGPVSGLFGKKKGAPVTMWISDDARRLPLKMQSEVKVGSVNAELKSITPATR